MPTDNEQGSELLDQLLLWGAALSQIAAHMHSFDPDRPPTQAKLQATMKDVIGGAIEPDLQSRPAAALAEATLLLADLNERIGAEVYMVPSCRPLVSTAGLNRAQRRRKRP